MSPEAVLFAVGEGGKTQHESRTIVDGMTNNWDLGKVVMLDGVLEEKSQTNVQIKSRNSCNVKFAIVNTEKRVHRVRLLGDRESRCKLQPQ